MPQDGDRDPWGPELSREIARLPGRATAGVYGAVPEIRPPDPVDSDEEEIEDGDEEIQTVPVRRQLSLAIAGFAVLLAAGLIFAAQTAGPDARTPYAIVVFGVQLLFLLSWVMAMRPPLAGVIAGIGLLAAAGTCWFAVTTDTPQLLPLLLVSIGAAIPALVAQQVRRSDRLRARDSVATTMIIMLGLGALATLIVLTRRSSGTQAVLVCLAAAGTALAVARLVDAFFAKPRLAPQVPRGATGVIVGAMLGTLAAGALGSVLVLPFNPAKGAVLGLVASGLAVLVDLAVDYSEAGRGMAGQAPTLWVARHMQGPLGAMALVAPAAYLLTLLVLD